MTQGNTVDLTVTGSTARQVAQNILNVVDMPDEGGDHEVSISVGAGDTTVEVRGTGPVSVGLVSGLLGGVDWEEVDPDMLSVSISPQTTDTSEGYTKVTDADPGERVGPWESPDVSEVNLPQTGTLVRDTFEALAELGEARSEDLAGEVEMDSGKSSQHLSRLYNEYGVVDRARVRRDGGDGSMYRYRINSHGRPFLGE